MKKNLLFGLMGCQVVADYEIVKAKVNDSSEILHYIFSYR
jgi:hypothetical protein